MSLVRRNHCTNPRRDPMTRTNWCERLSSHAVSTGKAFRNLLALSSSAGSCVAICAVLAGICQGPVAQAQNISTVVGNGTSGYSGDGGPATSAALNQPFGIAFDASGNLYIADQYNCLIREVSGGIITTIAGNTSGAPNCGYSGDGGPATSAQLNDTYGIAIDSAGNLYIADEVNCLVREVSGGIITAIAGNTSGVPNCWYTGDGAPATTFDLSFPQGITPDPSGN